MRNTPLVALCLAIAIVVTCVVNACRAQAQTVAGDSGVVAVVWPAMPGQAIIVQDGEGNLLDRIEPQDTIIARQYRLEPGIYEIHLPGLPEPVIATVSSGVFEPIGIGRHVSEVIDSALETGEIPLSFAGEVDPASNSLYFLLEPRPGTDDPGPSLDNE